MTAKELAMCETQYSRQELDELDEEARRCREHANNVEQYNADGARQAWVHADRIERAVAKQRARLDGS